MNQNLFEKAAPADDQAEPEVDEDPESDEGYRSALELMLSKLYEEGVAEKLGQALSSAPDKVQGVVEQTVNLLDVMEQLTQGSVPDELVMAFVLEATQQVVEIAQAAGVQLSNADIAAAVREVMAQVMENLGADTTQLREEMGKVDPAEVGRVAGGDDA